jgi:hypothetical protein
VLLQGLQGLVMLLQGGSDGGIKCYCSFCSGAAARVGLGFGEFFAFHSQMLVTVFEFGLRCTLQDLVFWLQGLSAGYSLLAALCAGVEQISDRRMVKTCDLHCCHQPYVSNSNTSLDGQATDF